jgi:hypothetical protein
LAKPLPSALHPQDARWLAKATIFICFNKRRNKSRHRSFLQQLGAWTGDNSRSTKASIWREAIMGRGILLWFLGIPIPLIIIILLFVR